MGGVEILQKKDESAGDKSADRSNKSSTLLIVTFTHFSFAVTAMKKPHLYIHFVIPYQNVITSSSDGVIK